MGGVCGKSKAIRIIQTTINKPKIDNVVILRHFGEIRFEANKGMKGIRKKRGCQANAEDRPGPLKPEVARLMKARVRPQAGQGSPVTK